MSEQTAYVIGGSAGMGLETAAALKGQGMTVVVGGRNPERMQRAVTQLGAGARAVPVDITDQASVEAAMAAVGHMDHLVLAGSGRAAWGPIADISAEQVLGAMEHKIVGYWRCIRAALPRLRVGGSILLFSGAASRKAMSGTAGLAAVNGGINRMAQTLALELAPTRVNVICPGLVDTPAYDGMPQAARSTMMEQGAGAVPIGRLGTAREVGAAAAAVVTNAYVNGAFLDCDGGTRL